MNEDGNDLMRTASAEAGAWCLVALFMRSNDNADRRKINKPKPMRKPNRKSKPMRKPMRKPKRKPNTTSSKLVTLDDPYSIIRKEIQVTFLENKKLNEYLGRVRSYCKRDGCHSVYFPFDQMLIKLNLFYPNNPNHIGPRYWKMSGR